MNVNNALGRGSAAVDINAIPAAAIDRIEVLRDGAAAQYGSDAIAGVINIILNKSTGYGAAGSAGVTSVGDGQVVEGSVYAGVPLGEKGVLNTTVFYRDHQKTNRAGLDTRQQYFGSGGTTFLSSFYGSGTGLTPSNGTLDLREATYNRLNYRRGDAQARDIGFFINGELPINNQVSLYGFGGYSRRKGQTDGFFRRAGQDETIRAIFPNGFLPQENVTSTDSSLTGGLPASRGATRPPGATDHD